MIDRIVCLAPSPRVYSPGMRVRTHFLALGLAVSVGAQEAGASVDSTTTSSRRYLLLPFGAYSEETGLQLGAMGMYFLPSSSPGSEGGSITAAGVVTTRGQRTFFAGPRGEFDSGRVDLSLSFSYSDWLGSYWYGGNSPYGGALGYGMVSMGARGQALFAADYLPGLPRALSAGASLDLERNVTDPDLPDSGMVWPSLGMGGHRVGFGPVLQWDSRDHKGGPTRGILLTASRTMFDDQWGSEWNFVKNAVDARGYVPLPMRQVLALGAHWEGVEGDVPFDRLSMPDGSSRMRGLEKGRLRGRQEMIFQSELRFPTPWWISGVAFCEAGKVGDDPGELFDNAFHLAYGAGVRLPVHAERRLNFRLDVAWVDDRLGVAASFGEAF